MDDDPLVYFSRTPAHPWVRVAGPMNPPCQGRNRLFSPCVYVNWIKVPAKIGRTPQPTKDAAPFILDRLLELLAGRNDIGVSEFELINLVSQWRRSNDRYREDSLHFFALNVLTAEEKAWTVG
ncbi:uncharacterized protein BCR38DRAFT_488550 [Pseudomassariella vexata]|uniref:Uncharacterized protein n=1 Tax=Pseudomassariella vexata TaxID=1141098 RepID=A0A1Y2DJZ6_9PEZI|nr:uncharacterized protein BCR38DRAFT_488550 [Pseudomassariella vexata]ORY59519.1 hypothetical protein BCR38DRAFT_488550 [Pseudomassariella vexata]